MPQEIRLDFAGSLQHGNSFPSCETRPCHDMTCHGPGSVDTGIDGEQEQRRDGSIAGYVGGCYGVCFLERNVPWKWSTRGVGQGPTHAPRVTDQ